MWPVSDIIERIDTSWVGGGSLHISTMASVLETLNKEIQVQFYLLLILPESRRQIHLQQKAIVVTRQISINKNCISVKLLFIYFLSKKKQKIWKHIHILTSIRVKKPFFTYRIKNDYWKKLYETVHANEFDNAKRWY